MKTTEQTLKEEIEQLERFNESEKDGFEIEHRLKLITQLKAELKGYTQAKKECEIEIAELKDKINNLLDCNLKLIKYEETIRKEVIEEVMKELEGDRIYPKDIFPELSEFQIQTIQDLCISHLRFPLDRLSAYISRNLLNNIRKKLEELGK